MAQNKDNQNAPNRTQKLKGWGFSFFGDTSATPEPEQKSVEVESKPETVKSFPLAMASVGERLSVVKLKGGEGTVHRLIGMGFAPGNRLQIISTTNGSVIVALGDNRIGLGMGMAQKILCRSEALS